MTNYSNRLLITDQSVLHPDPMGLAFQDYLKGKRNCIRVHSSHGNTDVVDAAYFFRSWDEMPEGEQLALELCRGEILDVGAGTGAHSLYLQQKGLDCLPIDISYKSVEVMHHRGLTNARCIDFFELKGKGFDTILMLMNGLGIMGSLNGLDSFFRHARQLLNPGGQILADSSDLMDLMPLNEGAVALNLSDRYYGEVEFQIEYEGKIGKAFKWLFVDFGNLCAVAEDNGFGCELLHENADRQYWCRLTPDL